MQKYLLILTYIVFPCRAARPNHPSVATLEPNGTLYSGILPNKKNIKIFIPHERRDNEAYVSCGHKPFYRTTSDAETIVPITFFDIIRVPLPGSNVAYYYPWSWSLSEKDTPVLMGISSAVMSITKTYAREKLLYCIPQYTIKQYIGIKKIKEKHTFAEQINEMAER